MLHNNATQCWTDLMKSQIVHDGGGGVKDHPVAAHHQGEACQRLDTNRGQE